MLKETTTLDFGEQNLVEASLSKTAHNLIGSEILKIAADTKAMLKAGAEVCNLTVGDFDSRYFPIPRGLAKRIRQAISDGETNYPPSDGVMALREAITRYVARNWGVNYPVESVLVASGARPILYGAYRCVLNRGDRVVYPVPSWNNNHYSSICEVESVVVKTRPEDGFMPTVDQLMPHLADARMLCLNSPLNPTGTVIDEAVLRDIVLAVVDENHRRTKQGKPHLFLLHDQIYASLVFGSTRHYMPVELVPEAAPWVISLDGISKGFAATGLRVGWLLAAPELTCKMKALIGHLGAWAPRPEQVALAAFLDSTEEVREYQVEMEKRVRQRLQALFNGFEKMKAEGYPVECIAPQGAIYLSLQLKLVGKTVAGRKMKSNESIRKLLLDEAGLSVVPFQAFSYPGDSGWFRLSVGAVSMEEIETSFPRIRKLLDTAT